MMAKRTVRERTVCKAEITETDIFIVYNGVRIAKRGNPDTPQARTWISLEPGFTVLNNFDLTELVVMRGGVRVH